MATLAALMTHGRFGLKIDRPFADAIAIITVLIAPYLPSVLAACEEIVNFVAGFKDERRIDPLRLAQYHSWLLQVRVMQVNDERINQIVNDVRRIVIPAIWYMQIRAIGECDKVGEGFILRPVWFLDGEDSAPGILHEQDFDDVIRWLRLAESHGLTLLRGLPRERDGVYEVMSMQVVDEVIRNHALIDQEAALVAGYFLNSTIEGLMKPRLRYLEQNEHVRLQRDLVPSFRRGGSPNPPTRRTPSAPATSTPTDASSHEDDAD
jgi:hypothetical protein